MAPPQSRCPGESKCVTYSPVSVSIFQKPCLRAGAFSEVPMCIVGGGLAADAGVRGTLAPLAAPGAGPAALWTLCAHICARISCVICETHVLIHPWLSLLILASCNRSHFPESTVSPSTECLLLEVAANGRRALLGQPLSHCSPAVILVMWDSSLMAL